MTVPALASMARTASLNELEHLVVASVVDDYLPTASRQLLAILIEGLKIEGEYAVEVGEGDRAVYCAFEVKDEADRLAAALNARPIGQYPGWSSQWAVPFNEEVRSRIAQDLSVPLVG